MKNRSDMLQRGERLAVLQEPILHVLKAVPREELRGIYQGYEMSDKRDMDTCSG